MSEIYRNAIGKGVTFGFPVSGTVTAKVGRDKDDLEDTSVSPSSSGSPVDRSAAIPFSITREDGPFYVEWTFTVSGDNYTRVDEHSIATPLVVFADSGLDDEELYDELEPHTRFFIENYTNNYFGYYEADRVVYGFGDDHLELPARLNSLESIAYDGWGVAEVTAGFIVGADGWQIRRDAGTPLSFDQDPVEDFTGLIAAPTPIASFRFFKDRAYIVSGGWGYLSVPEKVRRAATLLLDDWSCMDAKYRNKYLHNFRAADFRVQFKDKAYLGTGNLTADQLLSEFIVSPWELI